MVIRNRAALLRLIANPLLNFGDDYSAGNIEIEGDLVPFLEAVYRAMARPGEVRRRSGRRLPVEPGLRQLAHRIAPEHPAPLRHRQRLLPALAGRRDALHLRLLPRAGSSPWRRPRSPRWTWSAASCGSRAGRGSWRRAAAGAGWPATWPSTTGPGSGPTTSPASRSPTRGSGRGPRGSTGSSTSRTITATSPGSATSSSRSACWSTWAPTTTASSARSSTAPSSADGLGLIHTIGQNVAEPMSEWLEKRIFPGSYTPTVREMMEIFEPYAFSVLDLENLRLHYARTLEHWLERFEAHAAEVAQMFDDELRQGLAALPLRLHRQLHHRLPGALPGALLAPRQQPGSLDPRPPAATRESAMESCEVLIVGAGPAGSTCARILAKWGISVLLMDRDQFPRDKPCAGWITPAVLETLRIDPEQYRQGRLLQEIREFRTGVMYGRETRHRLRRDGELRHQAERVRPLPAAAQHRPRPRWGSRCAAWSGWRTGGW